jgi:hypothetical protein
MKALLTQLRVSSEDAGENFRGVAELIERSRPGLSHQDVLVLQMGYRRPSGEGEWGRAIPRLLVGCCALCRLKPTHPAQSFL